MLFMSALLHLGILAMVVLTFPLPKFSGTPYFVFLGSFLSDLDLLSVNQYDPHQQNVRVNEKFNLDIRKDSSGVLLNKPEAVFALEQADKIQFKPLTVKDTGVVKYKDNLDGLGIDVTPVKPVKMRLDLDDQN